MTPLRFLGHSYRIHKRIKWRRCVKGSIQEYDLLVECKVSNSFLEDRNRK